MSIFADPRHNRGRRGGRNHLGHLKLSVREESSGLAITIHEARGLRRREGTPSDTYVKLYLRPDPRKVTKRKSRRIKERDPIFNQKFSYILTDDDLDKSLSVSVWNRDWTGRNEVIGCMSFAVNDLLGPDREINGWYELLDVHKGAVENVPVPDSLSRMGSHGSLSSLASCNTLGPKNYAVFLVKGPRGYGFSVSTTTSPVMITYVEEGLPAHQQDLRVGDIIIEVENTDVTRANGDMIVNMIKKCKESVQLIVKRSPTFAPSCSSGGAAAASQPFLSQSYTDLSNGHPARRAGERSYHDSRRFSTGGMTQPADFSHWQYTVDDRPRVSTSRERISKSIERLPEVPEEGRSQTSNLNIPLPTTRQVLAANTQTTPTSPNGRKISQQSQRSDSFERSMSQHHLSSSQPGSLNTSSTASARHVKQLSGDLSTAKKLSLGSPAEGDQERNLLLGLAMQSVTQSKMNTAHQQQIAAGTGYQPRSLYSSKLSTSSYGSSDSAYATGLSSRSLNPDDQQSPTATSSPHRMSPEQRGLNRTHSGHYSSTGSPVQPDWTEEEIDWEGLSRLEQKRQRAINSLLKCEHDFHEELQNGVTKYLTPLGQGVLSEDSHRTIFMNIGKMFELSRYFCAQLDARAVHYCSPSSSVPLHVECIADIYHNKLQALLHVFSGYLRNMENAHKEIAVSFTNAEFKRIVQEPGRSGQGFAIYNFVDAGKEYLCKMSRLLVAISNLTTPSHPDHSLLYLSTVINALVGILPNSCRDLVKSWNNQLEAMEGLRMRIAFNNNVTPFPVSIPGRSLVHEGEVTLLEKKKKKKVNLWLFSDILLITKRTGRILNTLEGPIPLNQLMVQDLNCSTAEEFHTSTADGTINRQFRAPSEQAKVDWMQKLKERATGHLIIRGRGGAKEIRKQGTVVQSATSRHHKQGRRNGEEQQQAMSDRRQVKMSAEEEQDLIETLLLPSAMTQPDPVDDECTRSRTSTLTQDQAQHSSRYHMPRFLRRKKTYSSHSNLLQDTEEPPTRRRHRPHSLIGTVTEEYLDDVE